LETRRSVKNSGLHIRRAAPSSQVAFCLLLVGAGYGLFGTISQPDRYPTGLALSLSWLVAFFVSAFTAKLYLRMDPKRPGFARWEREGRVYEWMGVRAFQRVVLRTPLGWLNPVVQHRSDLDPLLRDLGVAEEVHRVGGGVAIVLALAYALAGYPRVGIWLVLFSVPLHLYPVMLQRWNRGRVWRMRRRADAIRHSRGKSRPASCES
jgi:hypothetical protein